MGGVGGEEKWRRDGTGAPRGGWGRGRDPRPDPLPTEAPSSLAGPEGMGGREGGAKVKARPPGPAPLRGGWGRGGVPIPSGTHPRLGVRGNGGDPGGHSAWGGREGMEGNGALCFPCPLRHWGAC